MLQPYNRIGLSPSAADIMKIKELIRNRTITKCCCLSTKNTFLILPLCSAVRFYFSILSSQLFGLLFKRTLEPYDFTIFYSFFASVYPANFFVVEIQKKNKLDFSINFRFCIYPSSHSSCALASQ